MVEVVMGEVHDIAVWRARKLAENDISIGSPGVIREQPCDGCGARRVGTMVWRKETSGDRRVPFPRIEPHFLCRDGRVIFQEITEAPIPMSSWSAILGHFEEEGVETGV